MITGHNRITIKKRWLNELAKVLYILVKPHKSIFDIADKRRAELASGLALILGITSFFGFLATYGIDGFTASTISLVINVSLSFVSYLFSRSRFIRLGAYLLLLNFLTAGFFLAFTGPEDTGLSLLVTVPLAFIVSSALVTVREMSVIVILTILITMSIPKLNPIGDHANLVTALGQLLTWGSLLIITNLNRNSIERERVNEIKITNKELSELQVTLEEQVGERTLELNLASELGRIISQIRDKENLLETAVNLIQERFNLYYVQVYLIETDTRSLLLQAGSGDIGEQLKKLGHRLPIDAGSLNGRAAYEKIPVVIEDTYVSPSFRANVLLPDTRSELCVPILLKDRVLGVLDIQSKNPGDLSEANIPAYISLAGQLAVALENANLNQLIIDTISDIEAQARITTREGWQDYLNAVDRESVLRGEFNHNETKTDGDLTNTTLPKTWARTPITISGVPVGAIKLAQSEYNALNDREKEILKGASYQLSRQVENLRLLTQSEQYRIQAENISKRITRDSWQSYLIETGQDGKVFIFDQNKVSAKGELDTEIDQEQFIKSVLSVRGSPIGELMISGTDNLEEDDQEMVSAIADRLSSHLENLRLSTQTQEALFRTNSLYEIGQWLQSGKELNLLLDDILHTLVHTTGAAYAYFLNVDMENKKIKQYYRSDLGEIDHKNIDTSVIISGLNGWVIKENESILTSFNVPDHRESEYDIVDRKQNSLGSLCLVPIQAGSSVVGILKLVTKSHQAHLTRQDLITADAVANQLGTFIENRDLLKRTHSLAIRVYDLREISSRFRLHHDPDKLLQSVVMEIGKVMNRNVAIKLDENVPHDVLGQPQNGDSEEVIL